MLFGIPPYFNENVEKMYELIRLADLKFPRRIKISAEAQDLISKLLERNINNRLGAKNGFSEIKSHPFFNNLDFDLILQKKLNAPYKPEIEDKYDTQYFDEEFTSEDLLNSSLIPESNLEVVKKCQEQFKDF